MRRILVAVLTLAPACVAMAGEWNFITTTGKGKDVEAVAYDRDAIVTLDEGINVWFAWVNSNPSLKHDLLLMMAHVDCKQKRLKFLQLTPYFRGKHLESIRKEDAWDYAIPGTLGEALVVFPCRKIEADVNIKTGSLMELVKKGKELLKEETSKKETKL